MNEDNALRMAAEVTDRFTVPLKNLQAQLRKIKSPPNITELQKDLNKLGQTVGSAGEAIKGTFIPVLSALGVTTFTVGAALAKVVSSMIELSKETVELSFLAKETGISVNNLRDMQSAAKSVGVDSATFQSNLRNFSVVMEQINRRQGDTLKWLQNSPDPKVRELAQQLIGTTDNFKAFNLVMNFLQNIKSPAQWNYWVSHFGLDVKMGREATKNWDEELKKARDKHGALTGEDIQAAEDYKTAMGKLKGQFDQFIATVSREALPAITKLIEATITWMASNGDQLAKDIREMAEGLNELADSMTKFKAAMGAIIAVGLGSWIGGLAGAAIGLYAAYLFMRKWEMPEWMTKLGELVGGGAEIGEKNKGEGGGKPPEPKPQKSSILQEEEEKENLKEGSKEAFLNGLREFYGPDAGVTGGSIDISSSNRYGGGLRAGTGGGRGSYTGGKGFGNYEPSMSPSGYINPITGTVGRGVGETPSASASGVHEGQDIGADVGTPVHAVKDGTIISVKNNRGIAGKTVTIRHDDGSHSRYLHLDDHRKAAQLLTRGGRIKQGDVFGTSGFANSPHLHYEVWPGQPGVGKPYNLWELHNWQRGQNIGGGLPVPTRPDGGRVLDFGKRSGLIGAPPIGSDASLRVKIDLNGFPRGTQFASNMSGVVDSISVNRNRPPMNEGTA